MNSQKKSRVYYLHGNSTQQAMSCPSSYVGYSDFYTEKGVEDWFYKGKRHDHRYVVGKSAHWSQEEISSYGVVPNNLFKGFYMSWNTPTIQLIDGSILQDFTKDRVFLRTGDGEQSRLSVEELTEMGILNKLDYDDCEQAGIETARGFGKPIRNNNIKNSKSYRVGVSPLIADFVFKRLFEEDFYWACGEADGTLSINKIREIINNHREIFGNRFLSEYRCSWIHYAVWDDHIPQTFWANKRDISILRMCEEIRGLSATKETPVFDIEEMRTLASTLKTLGNFGDSMIKSGLAKSA
jgi:hypothetical protein